MRSQFFSFRFRESIAQHVLTVMVKDAGTPAKRNYARVVIDVFDANDHAPEFSMSIMQGRVFETAAIGTTVVQAFAMDKDHGDNAAITYHIASGKYTIYIRYTEYIVKINCFLSAILCCFRA
jgi:protocadherin Fat 1/2/3